MAFAKYAPSQIEQFARAIWIGAFSEANLVIVLDSYAAYFDRSHGQKDDETVVAGFVSSVQQWGQWEAEWRLTLAEFDVPYFHMKEFNAKQGPFAASKWESNEYRAAFTSKLIAITNQWSIAAICSSCEQVVFDEVNREWELDRRFNPYAFCGRDCAVRVKKIIRQQVQSSAPIAYVFDRGDEGRGKLMKEMERSDMPTPIFRKSRPDIKNPEKDTDDPPVIQLQACDLLAWEIMRGQHDVRRKDEYPQLRKSVVALGTNKSRYWFGSDVNDVRNLCIAARIAKRAPDSSKPAHLYWVMPCKNLGCAARNLVKYIGPDDGRDTYVPSSETPAWINIQCSGCGTAQSYSGNDLEIHKLNAERPLDMADAF